eukprot:7227983-Alexandrium_andersonii.AAC.1
MFQVPRAPQVQSGTFALAAVSSFEYLPRVALATISRSQAFPARRRPERHQSLLAGKAHRKREIAFPGP